MTPSSSDRWPRAAEPTGSDSAAADTQPTEIGPAETRQTDATAAVGGATSAETSPSVPSDTRRETARPGRAAKGKTTTRAAKPSARSEPARQATSAGAGGSGPAELTPSAPAPDVVAGSAPAEATADLDPRDETAVADRPVASPVHEEGTARDRGLARYAAAADTLRAAVRELSADELRASRLDDGSSIARLLVRLADSELHGVARMRRIIAEPGSVLQPYDDKRWVAALEELTSPDAALELFAALRRVGEEVVRAATPAQRAQRCFHPEHGEVTLDLLLERHAEDAEGVIARIRSRE